MFAVCVLSSVIRMSARGAASAGVAGGQPVAVAIVAPAAAAADALTRHLCSAACRNNKGVINDWRIVLALPLLLLIDFLLKTPPIARALFDAVAQ
jgi:hypothetical protein